MSSREISDAKSGIANPNNKAQNYKTLNFRDPIVERVVDKFVSRSNVGFENYGQTLETERTQGFKDLAGYLNDVQEELMDAVLYIQAAREEVRDWLEEFSIERMNVIGQNGNNGLHYADSGYDDETDEEV